jgi:hypothetical protein
MLHPREERRDFKDDEALRQELIAEYRRRRNQNLCVLTCFYLIAPTVGILMVVIAFTD